MGEYTVLYIDFPLAINLWLNLFLKCTVLIICNLLTKTNLSLGVSEYVNVCVYMVPCDELEFHPAYVIDYISQVFPGQAPYPP